MRPRRPKNTSTSAKEHFIERFRVPLSILYTILPKNPAVFKIFICASVTNYYIAAAMQSQEKNISCKVRSEVNFPSSFFDCDMRDKSVPEDQRKEDGMVPVTECFAEWRLITNG